MGNRFDAAYSAVLGISALAIAGSVVFRTFAPSIVHDTTKDVDMARPDYVESWMDALPIGIRVGPSTAPVTIVELADLECPACRAFHSTAKRVLRARADKAALVYVSFPLPMHRFALGAARAAECAEKIGRFNEWVDAVYERQDSLGLRSCGQFAYDAGIGDTAAMARCAVDPRPVQRIEDGRAFGAKIRIRGTPTVLVNGWRFPYVPSEDELKAAIDSLANGRPPFDDRAPSAR